MSTSARIIAHTDLKGGYRLIRLISEPLSTLLAQYEQESLTLQGLSYGYLLFSEACRQGLPYLRKAPSEHKIDFLFLRHPDNKMIESGRELTNIKLIPQPFRIEPVGNYHVTGYSPAYLGCGLAQSLSTIDAKIKKNRPLLLFELIDDSPYPLIPSLYYLRNLPTHVTATMQIIEEQGKIARFCSTKAKPGCFEGSIDALVKYLQKGE